MPSFYYRARDQKGLPHEGVQVAASEEDVVRALERAQLVPIFIETRGAGRSADPARLASGWQEMWARQRSAVKPVNVALFARQLATMVAAGLPVVRSLHSIGRDLQDRKLAGVLSRVADSVQRGEALSAALARHPGAFDPVFVSLVQTGEVSGTLDRILDQTATYLERSEALRVRVQAALRYPMFVAFVMLAVLIGMLGWIVPQFSSIYARFRVPIPWATRLLLDASNFLVHNALAITAGALGAALIAIRLLRSEPGRLAWDRFRMRMPIFGPVVRMYATSKFARAMGILTAAGIQILYALKVVRPVPGNMVMERAVDQVRAQVEEGTTLAQALGAAGVFPDMLLQMTATGEETGKLDTMLSRTADAYEQRVSATVDGMASLIEPATIVVLAVVVLLMLLALYLPIFSLGQAMRAGIGAP